MSDPSVAVAEAFKQFLQVTVSALRAYEHGNRARLDQAEDDLRVLRRERDDSLRDLNACKEQTRAWAADVNRWKAEADSALIVNKHQAELISQLRQEAQQWKDQCLRLEETLRGEIKSWKDQFLRIDAEHTRLLNQLSTSSSSKTTLVNTPKRVPILAAGESSTTSTATKRCKSASSSTARADKDRLLLPTTHSPTKTLPFPRVLRRVQAVIEVPVKEEEEEIDGSRVDWPPDSAVLQPTTSTPTGTTNGGTGAGAGASTSSRGGGRGSAKRRKSSASSHQRSLAVPPSAEEWRSFVVDDEEEGEEPPSDEEEEEEAGDDGGEYVEDEEEVEIAIANGTPATGGRKTVPWGRKHVGHEPDEEDDELMMYAKDNPHRVRPPHENSHPHPPPARAPARRKSITDVTAQRLSATNNSNNASAAKRRTTETGPGGSAHTKRRR